MGGVVNVAIRLRDGRAFCQERWTNNMPFWFQDPKMFEGDEEHVLGYINAVAENDWIADPGAPGLPMPVENSEYGLMVWDYMSGTILDNNHYSHPCSFDPISTGGDMLKENFIKLADAGRIYMRTYTYPPRKDWPRGNGRIPDHLISHIDTPLLSPDDAKRLGQEMYEARCRWRMDEDDNEPTTRVEFIVDPSPMKYLWMGDHSKYYDEETGEEPLSSEYLRILKEIGFPMTEAEGLNQHLPYTVPASRKIGQREEIARDLFQDYKSEDETNQFIGVPFDNLDPAVRQKFLDKAFQLMDDPEALRAYRLNRMIGGATTTVLFQIGGSDKSEAN